MWRNRFGRGFGPVVRKNTEKKILIPNYITNAATCFGTSAPSSGSFDTAFAKAIRY
jgi:hypothetical protein